MRHQHGLQQFRPSCAIEAKPVYVRLNYAWKERMSTRWVCFIMDEPLKSCNVRYITPFTFYWFVLVHYSASFCLHISNDTNGLTGTLSGYFFLIFSPSDRLFSKGCSSLYWNFMVVKGDLSQKQTEVSEM